MDRRAPGEEKPDRYPARVAAPQHQPQQRPKNLMPPGLEAKTDVVVDPDLRRWIRQLREKLYREGAMADEQGVFDFQLPEQRAIEVDAPLVILRWNDELGKVVADWPGLQMTTWFRNWREALPIVLHPLNDHVRVRVRACIEPCIVCGGDVNAPDHGARCQAFVEASLPTYVPPFDEHAEAFDGLAAETRAAILESVPPEQSYALTAALTDAPQHADDVRRQMQQHPWWPNHAKRDTQLRRLRTIRDAAVHCAASPSADQRRLLAGRLGGGAGIRAPLPSVCRWSRRPRCAAGADGGTAGAMRRGFANRVDATEKPLVTYAKRIGFGYAKNGGDWDGDLFWGAHRHPGRMEKSATGSVEPKQLKLIAAGLPAALHLDARTVGRAET